MGAQTLIGHRGHKDHAEKAIAELKKKWPAKTFISKPTGSGSGHSIHLEGQPDSTPELQQMRMVVEATQP